MSTRSMTPRTSCSMPIGISVATTCAPNAAFRASSVRKKSARSRSSMFTKTMRARSSSSARCQRRVVVTSTPITAFTTKIADSHTRMAPSASATKLGSPGVSMRLILRSCHSNELSDALIDICRACSSESASEAVVPSVTEPSRLTTPAWYSSASFSEVLPLPRWPTRATFLMRSARCMPLLLSSGSERRTLAATGPNREGSAASVDEPRAQPQHGLRVQLADARLGDAEDLADLSKRQVLVVVEGDDELLAFGQAGDRVGHAVLEVGLVEGGGRVGRVGVVQRVEQRDLVAARVAHGPQLVEGGHRGVGDLQQRVLELLDGDAQLGGHLLVGRCALETVLEPRVGLLDVAGAGAHRARHPVQRAQFVDDRALDAGDRVGLELDLAAEVEALDRVDEADQAVGDEVGLLDVGGQARCHAPRDVLDERRVGDHEALARVRVPGGLVAAPE